MMFRSKKGMEMVAKVLVLVAVALLAIFIAYTVMSKSGKTAQKPLTTVFECGGFGSSDETCVAGDQCPPGTVGYPHESCPKQRFADVGQEAEEHAKKKEEYAKYLPKFEEEHKVKISDLNDDQLNRIKAEYFGYCCKSE